MANTEEDSGSKRDVKIISRQEGNISKHFGRTGEVFTYTICMYATGILYENLIWERTFPHDKFDPYINV